MDASEEVVGSNDYSHVIKGKRTKRQRPSSPLVVPMSTTSSSTEEGGSGGDGYGNSGGGDGSSGDDHISPSPTISAEFSESTEEEEDMANCLILLAQGHNRDDWKRTEEKSTMGKSEFYVYECKTCNRCFPSFQALGGHRASHKKPKSITDQKKALILFEDDIQFPSLNLEMGNRNLYSNNNNKSKIHECSICGSEFSSGQALGGHMRRHKTPTANSESQDQIKKQRNVLSLDLNLPAPEDDQEPKFSFVSKQRSLVFSASALVDCHY